MSFLNLTRKKILTLTAIIAISFISLGCIQVDSIQYTQRQGSYSKSYPVNSPGETLINQSVDVNLALSTTSAMNNNYMFLAIGVPNEFTPEDLENNFYTQYDLRVVTGIPVPNKSLPQGYKWITYAVMFDQEITNKISYTKGESNIKAKLAFNVGNLAQSYDCSAYVFQTASTYEAPVQPLPWTGIKVNGNCKPLTIYNSFTQLSERNDDYYVIIKSNQNITGKTFENLKGFHIAYGKTLTLTDSSHELKIYADDIDIRGTINATGKGYQGGQGGTAQAVSVFDFENTANEPITSIIENTKGKNGGDGGSGENNDNIFAGSGGIGGKSGKLNNGYGGESGTQGKTGNGGSSSYLNETASAGQAGGGGGAGGNGGFAVFYPSGVDAPPYSYSLHAGGQAGNGGAGGNSGAAILLSGKQVYIGPNSKILCNGNSGIVYAPGSKGKGTLPLYIGGAGGDLSGANSEDDTEIYSDGSNGYTSDEYIPSPYPNNYYTYAGPWDKAPVGIVFSGISSGVDFGNPLDPSGSAIFNSVNDSIVFKISFDASSISFKIKGGPGVNNQGDLYVQVSQDGSNYYYAGNILGASVDYWKYTALIPDGMRFIRIIYSKQNANSYYLIDDVKIQRRSGFISDGGGGGGGCGGSGGNGGGGAIFIKATENNGLTIDPTAIISTTGQGKQSNNDGQIILMAPLLATNVLNNNIQSRNEQYLYNMLSGQISQPAQSAGYKWNDQISISWNINPAAINYKNENGAVVQETILSPKQYRFSFSTDDGNTWSDLFGNSSDNEANWETMASNQKTWLTANLSDSYKDIETVSARIRIEIKDTNGKISEIISNQFKIDSKGPSISTFDIAPISAYTYDNSDYLPVSWSGVSDLNGLKPHQIKLIKILDDGSENPIKQYNFNNVDQTSTYNLYIKDVPSGSYKVVFTASDQLGNLSSKEASTNYLRDVNAPAVKVQFDACQTTLKPVFNISIEDKYSIIKLGKIKIGSTTAKGQYFTQENTLLTAEADTHSYSDGSYQFIGTFSNGKSYDVIIEAEDILGNKIEKKCGTIIIHAQDPAIEIESISPMIKGLTGATPTFDWKAIVPQGIIDPTIYVLQIFTTLADAQAGTNPVYAYVYDLNNNESSDLVHSIPADKKLAAGNYYLKINGTGSFLGVSVIKAFEVKASLPKLLEHLKIVPSGVLDNVVFDLMAEDKIVGIDKIKVEIISKNPVAPWGQSENQGDSLNWPVSFSDDENGEYDYIISVSDMVGNVYTENNSFTVDTKAPTITLNAPFNSQENDIYVGTSQLIISGEINDLHLKSIKYSVGEVVNTPEPTPPAYNLDAQISLADGTYPVTIEAKDVINNEDHTTSINKTVIIDTKDPVITSVEVDGNVVNPGATMIVPLLTPKIAVDADDLNLQDIKVSISTCIAGVEPQEYSSNNNSLYETINAIQNKTCYTVTIIASDKAGHKSAPFTFYLSAVAGKIPTQLNIVKEQAADGNYTGKYQLSWQCESLEPGESFVVLRSTDQNNWEQAQEIADQDGSITNTEALIASAPNQNSAYFFQVRTKNPDNSYSLASNTVIAQSIILSNTTANQLKFPAYKKPGQAYEMEEIALDISNSNLASGLPYVPVNGLGIFDVISIQHLPSTLFYEMTYIDQWYMDYDNNKLVNKGDEIKIFVSDPLNWIIVGNLEAQ